MLSGVTDRLMEGAVSTALDANWRGAFDLLVTRDHVSTALTDQLGRGLVDPNFLSTYHTPIDMARVDRVKSLEGVEFAAPVGLLGRYANTLDWARLEIPVSELSSGHMSSFHIQWDVVRDDGINERIAQREDIYLTIDAKEWNGADRGRGGDIGIKVTGSLPSYDPIITGDVLSLSLLPLPSASTLIFAVDPEDEKRLLGDAATFLDPLISANNYFHKSHVAVTPESVVYGESSQSPFWTTADIDAVRTNTSRYLFATGRGALTGMYGASNPLTPYLKYENAYPPLTLTTTISRIRSTETEPREVPQPGDIVGEVTIDVSKGRWPFTGSSIVIPWPGEGHTEYSTGYVMSDVPTGLSGLQIESFSPGAKAHGESPNLVLRDPEYLAPVRALGNAHPDGTYVGEESIYREDSPSVMPAKLGTATTAGAAPIAVGTYGSVNVDQTEAAYVPLGAYDPATVTLPNGARLQPTLHGLGISGQPASALVTIDGARGAFGVKDPVSAIRVKVAGIERYDAAGRSQLNRVKASIERLGLHVTEVAGASRQEVTITAPGYAFGTMSEPSQTVGTLSPLSAYFTTLSAAASVDATMISTRRSILDSSLQVVAVSLALVWFVGLRSRRRSDRLFKDLGISWPERIAKHLRLDFISILLICVGCAVGVWVGSSGRFPIMTAGVGALISVLMSAIISVFTTEFAEKSSNPQTRPGNNSPSKKARVQEAPTYARVVVRVVFGMAPALVLGAFGTMIFSTGLTIAMVTLITGQRILQTTSLGVEVSVVAEGFFIAVFALGAVAGLVLCSIASRMVAERVRVSTRVLRDAAGWSSRDVRGISLTIGLIFISLVSVGSVGALLLMRVSGFLLPQLTEAAYFAWGASALGSLVIFTGYIWRRA